MSFSLFRKALNYTEMAEQRDNLPFREGLMRIVTSMCPKCGHQQHYHPKDPNIANENTKCLQCGEIYDATKDETGIWGIFYHNQVFAHTQSRQLENLFRTRNNLINEADRVTRLLLSSPDITVENSKVYDLWNPYFEFPSDASKNPFVEIGAEKRLNAWNDNCAKNKEHAKETTAKFHGTGKGKTAILVAPGPTLAKNKHLFKHIDKSKYIVIGCNIMPPDVVPYLDYYFIGDYQGDLEGKWLDPSLDFSNTTACYRISASHRHCVELSKDRFKEVCWWKDRLVNKGMEKTEFPDLPNYIMVLTIMSAMVHFAIKLNVERFVFVGYNCAFPNDEEYMGKKLANDKTIHGREYIYESDLYGNRVKTYMPYAFQCEYMYRLCFLGARHHGKTFANCSEGGIFHDHKMPFHYIELHSLAQELNIPYELARIEGAKDERCR